MKAFLLGAGLGTRLAPLTHILPKPLVPFFQKPLLQHAMDRYIRSGVEEFIINTSCLEPMWEQAFPKGEYDGRPVRFSHEETPLDSGGGIARILPFLSREEPLLVHNGDIFTDFPVEALLEHHRREGNLVTLALRSKDGNRNVGFDPATGRVTDMRHALGIDPGSCQFAGVYIMDPAVADFFPQEEIFSIVPVWLELIRQGRVGGVLADWPIWYEIGTPASYLDAVMSFSSSRRIHPDARISALAELGEDCVVGKEAVIPAGCTLDDCIVWPRTHVKPGTYRRCILTPCIQVQV